jgi:phage terminase large subunit
LGRVAEITIPNNWQPRGYQRRIWKYLCDGGKRAVPVWHRRSGKDEVFLHWSAVAAMERQGNYWHMLPEAAQARKAIWDAVNPHSGKRRIDEAFPMQIRASTNATEMKIQFVNGSIWQLVGSDNFNSLVGSPPVGLVFSEYALANPRAWDYLRPILAENGGWAAFPSTPRGKNHLHDLFQMAKTNPLWFAEQLTINHTGVISQEIIAEERRSGMTEDEIQQEYFVSFDAAIKGAYYGVLMREAEEDGRICNVPHDPRLKVHTAWDLGIGDSTSIWFVQVHSSECRVIDYYESFGNGLEHYAKTLKEGHRAKYQYGDHILPHDAAVADLSTGKARIQTLNELGISGRILNREGNIDDGISAARGLLPRCWFDTTKCAHGIEALKQYRCDYDEERKIFSNRPRHDWTSHAADAFRYLARGLPDDLIPQKRRDRYRSHSGGETSWMSV